MIYKRNNRKISQQLRINIMDPVVLVFGRYNFYNPSQLLLPPCPPYYPTVDKFYYLPCPPCYLQWTVTPRSNLQRSTIFYSHLSDQNGFCPTILSTETGGFIQNCQPHSSYHIHHHTSSDMCYRAGNDDNLHGWCVSPMQNHTIYLRVR